MVNDRTIDSLGGQIDDEERQMTDEAVAADGAEHAGEMPDLATVAEERDRYLDQLQRSMAEFANYRRRVDQERQQARRLATRDLLASIVPIADDLQRAIAAIPPDQAESPWVKGVQLIERNLEAVLEREGVSQIAALGEPFDPSRHEAVAVDPGSSGSVVVEVFQNGYWHGDQVLRPAMVRVGDPIDGHDGTADAPGDGPVD